MTLTTERLKWLHDAATELSATKLKMTMRPDELLVLTSELLANREAQPVYQYRMRNPYNGQVTDWETIKPEQVDFILKETIAANVEFRIITAPPAPAVPDAWIACSERMPEPNKYVQVSNGAWVGVGMYNDADHLENDERWQDERQEFIDLLYSPVTHWMPLPAAPKGGK